ncbi:MAG: DUF72 domain-containing protein [Bryobacteraceae bacterium]
MNTLPLFDEPSSFDTERLKRRLTELAHQDILIGGSSWKYEGWLGQIYTEDRYLSRGRFSQKRFQAECLNEYAEIFPIVCGDFSFYLFPSPEYWARLFGSAPKSLRYAFKVPEEITVNAFPIHPRYGSRAGERNDSFLNAALFQSGFLDLLRPYRSQIAVLIFEFGTFPKRCYENAGGFVRDLDPFLALLPLDFRYAVEIRNQEFLVPEYFACLHRHGMAHVLNAWTRMPPIAEQMQMPDVFTADFTVARALLRQGRPYENAVASFAPYRELQDPNPETRGALRELIARAKERNQPAYIFVNNRLEGNSPATIEAIVT